MKDNVIQLSVPPGFQADEVTITLRRIPTVIKDLPPGQDQLLLSDGQKPAKSKLREPWEPGELSYLVENYGKLPKKDIARHLGRSISACHTKYWETQKKGKTEKKSEKGRHQWTAEDDAYLIKNEGTCEEQADHLGVSVQRVWAHRFELKEKGLMSLGFSKKGKKPKSKWTDEANLYLAENKGTKEEQATHLGVTVRALECQRTILRKKGFVFDRPHEKKCRVCGCTEDNACMTEGVPCSWVEDDLCSACKPADSPPWEPGSDNCDGRDAVPAKDVTEEMKKEPLWRQALNTFKRTPDLPEDFDYKQKFGLRCYVWHQAGKEIGRMAKLEGDFCYVEFGHTTKKFTILGCRTMYEAMMAFAQDR